MIERDPRFAVPSRPAPPFRVADARGSGVQLPSCLPGRGDPGAGRGALSIVRFGRYMAVAP